MFVDELSKIIASEEKADEIQKSAKAESRNNLEDARARAAKIIEDAEGKARDIYSSLIAEGDQTSDQEYSSYLKQTEKDSSQLMGQAEDRKNKAVDLIAERIVNLSVDR